MEKMVSCSLLPMSESEGGQRFPSPIPRDAASSAPVIIATSIVSNIARYSFWRLSNDVFKTPKSCGGSKASTMSSNSGTVAWEIEARLSSSLIESAI